MENPNSPIRPTDDEARTLGRNLLSSAKFAALGTLDPDTRLPVVTRIALGTTEDAKPISLISDLSLHTRALKHNPIASLLVGEPRAKGDPLTHPRLTLQVNTRFLNRQDTEFVAMRAHYLKQHPKSKLYIDFADFSFAVFQVEHAYLNGGFGKAFELTPADLAQPD
jgi:putative heme iron utilization protein